MAKISENNECDFKSIENLTYNVNDMEYAMRLGSINREEKTPSNHTSTQCGGTQLCNSKAGSTKWGDTQEAEEHNSRQK